MSVRDRIFNSKLDAEVVVIPEWDNVKIEVRARTVDQQYALIDKVRKPNGDLDNKLLAVETIIATAYDPDTGEAVFEPADRDTLRGLNAAGFNRLLAAANRAAGLETEDQVVADLDETPPSETSTS